ncbi:MAG: outer membrane lipoprotein carrier protein LolA [Acidobacteriia bacterium]|nr:outer membrane lipoprotein carrier protein LolA [Terriglobia bacterium]
MTRFVRFAFLAAMAGMVLKAETLNDILARMDQSARTFRTFTANIKRTEYTKVLNDKEDIEGVERVKRTNGQTVTLVEFHGPNAQTIRLSSKTAEVYYPAAKMVEIWDAGKYARAANQFLLLGFGTSSAELRKDYEVSLGGTDTLGSTRTSRLDLAPKDAETRKKFAKIELWIPEGDTVPIQVKVTETSQNYNLAVYSNIKVNEPLPDSELELKVPPDVKKVPRKL